MNRGKAVNKLCIKQLTTK